MRIGDQQILLVGDRVLVKPEGSEERTKVGLYVPQTVIEKEPVQSGRVVAVGPGLAYPSPTADGDEPWQESSEGHYKYIPVQVEVGDLVLFLKKEAIEIQHRRETYLVLPQNAVLLVVRDESPSLPFESDLPDLME